MASAWGKSWGYSWGNSWGRVAVAASPIGGGKKHKPRFFDVWAHEQEALAKLHQDDQLATELLVSIVLKGFFDGTHQHSSP